jgi:MerR family copper efflux transcriptional regulator
MSDGDTPDRMTIGQLAQAVHKTPRALRLYEEKGLIVPECRSVGGFRLYGPSAVVRLGWICKLSALGLSLDDIQTLLEDIGRAERGDVAMTVLRDEYQRRLAELDAQLIRLTALRRGVEAGLAYLERCRGCQRTPLPECCGGCIAEVGDNLPDMIAGLLSQPPADRVEPCRGVGGTATPSEDREV